MHRGQNYIFVSDCCIQNKVRQTSMQAGTSMLGTLTSRNEPHLRPRGQSGHRSSERRRRLLPSQTWPCHSGHGLIKFFCQPTINLLQRSAPIRGTCSLKFKIQVRQACNGHHNDHAAQSQDPLPGSHRAVAQDDGRHESGPQPERQQGVQRK